MRQLAALAAAGTFDRIALSTFALDDARKALEQSRSGGVRGKILLAPTANLQS
jgi:NADPH:quinone reductase-like Zn-dependent oxidoreductase